MKSKPFNYFLKYNNDYADSVLVTNNYKEALDCLENYVVRGLIVRNISTGLLTVYELSENTDVQFKRNKIIRNPIVSFKFPNDDVPFDLVPNTVVERVKDVEVKIYE